MPYVLCTKDYWLGFDKKSRLALVHSAEDAYKWSNKNRAQNALKSLSNKLKPYGFNVKESVEIPTISDDIVASNGNYNIDDKIQEIHQFVNEIEERKRYLIKMVRRCELELLDIEHYAEFNELNAAKGYQVYKMIHDARKKRRAYKDELQKIELILSAELTKRDLALVMENIRSMEHRKYSPRVRKDLF